MPDSQSISLRPSVGRLTLFILGTVAAVTLPVGVLLLAAVQGPPPYVLRREALTDGWMGVNQVGASRVKVSTYPSANAALGEAARLANDIPSQDVTQTLAVRRYSRRDTGWHGLILPVEQVLVQIEGPDEVAVDQALASLPFATENVEKNLLLVLFSEHPRWMLGAGAVYVVFCLVTMVRAAAWVARVRPPPSVSPIPADDLRRRLVAVGDAPVPFEVGEEATGDLVATWRLTDSRWTGLFEQAGLKMAYRIHLRLDRDRHRVLVQDRSTRVTWSHGTGRVSWSRSFFRGITFYEFESEVSCGVRFRDSRWTVVPDYAYRFDRRELKQPLVEAIVSSGWTYQPVVTLAVPVRTAS